MTLPFKTAGRQLQGRLPCSCKTIHTSCPGPDLEGNCLQSLLLLWMLSTSVCSGCCVPFQFFSGGCSEGWSCFKYLLIKIRERQEQSRCEEGGPLICWKSSRLAALTVNPQHCWETRVGGCVGCSGGMALLPREAACRSRSTSVSHMDAELRLRMPLCSSLW